MKIITKGFEYKADQASGFVREFPQGKGFGGKDISGCASGSESPTVRCPPISLLPLWLLLVLSSFPLLALLVGSLRTTVIGISSLVPGLGTSELIIPF